jgi:hypothetical protein
LPNPPSINRGILILLAPNAKDANISSTNPYFAFQYNPEKLLHTFNQATTQAASGNSTSDMAGSPVEEFNLTFDLDSLDLDPPNQNQIADTLGVHPALAMLELMMQPQTVANQPVMPIAVFKWGAKRAVPVRVTNINVEEKTFDQTLNPTRATVTLTLRVLNASELGNNTGAKSVYANHREIVTTLADAYRTQTGQPPSGGAVTGASGVTGDWSAIAPMAPGGSVVEAGGTIINKTQTKAQQTSNPSKRVSV